MSPTTYTFHRPTGFDWILAIGSALGLALVIGGLNWVLNGEFTVRPEIVAGVFTGMMISSAGLSMSRRPLLFLGVVSLVAAAVIGLSTLIGV